jgi:hypothetical protein
MREVWVTGCGLGDWSWWMGGRRSGLLVEGLIHDWCSKMEGTRRVSDGWVLEVLGRLIWRVSVPGMLSQSQEAGLVGLSIP